MQIMVFTLIFYFKMLTNSICVHVIICKNLLFQVMMFNWIFPNHPCIHTGKHLFAKKKKRKKMNLLISWLENVYVSTNCFFKFSSNFFGNSCSSIKFVRYGFCNFFSIFFYSFNSFFLLELKRLCIFQYFPLNKLILLQILLLALLW